MGNFVHRDPYAMEKFAEEIEEYVANMTATCRDLQSYLDLASPSLQDPASQKSLKQLEKTIQEIVDGLSHISTGQTALRASAQPLKALLNL